MSLPIITQSVILFGREINYVYVYVYVYDPVRTAKEPALVYNNWEP